MTPERSDTDEPEQPNPSQDSTPTTRPPVTIAYDRRLSAEWLRDHYNVQQLSIEAMARQADVCVQTGSRALKRHQIPLRPRRRHGVPYSLGDVLTEPYLREQYEQNKRTVKQIAAEIDCSEAAVMARLSQYGIPRRGVQPADKLILTEVLSKQELHLRRAEGQSNTQIAQVLGADEQTVAAYCRRYQL